MAHEINLRKEDGTQKSLMDLWSATFAHDGTATSPASNRQHTSDGHTQTELTAFGIKKINSSYSNQYGESPDRSSLYDSNTDTDELDTTAAKINVSKSKDAYSKIQKDFPGYTSMEKIADSFKTYTEGAFIDPDGSTRKL